MPILEDGQLFERYRVRRWLGSGIAGESYEADDRILQRKVMLKLIHPWATLSDSARRQFFREMQGISLLNHPYLATVLDYGEVDGRIYVARRYVSSGSLLGTNGRLWFHPPLPVPDAFKYAHQLAQALQYIHQHAYTHGSLTFANVLVLRGSNVEKTADYAPFLIADADLAHFVRRFGHPRIETLPVSTAPEQASKRVVPASDQFALAVLLYFWLAGRPPYLGASDEIERQKMLGTITPLSILNPGITLEQDSIVLRALATYPEDRYSSVLAFAEALIASLTSPNRQYAPVFDTFTPFPPETPREFLPIPPTASPAQPESTVQVAPMDYTPAVPIFTQETFAPASPVPPVVEPYHASMNQHPIIPQTEPEYVASAIDSSQLSNEGSAQNEFIPHVAEEAPAASQASKQTGPLASEPTAAQAGEAVQELANETELQSREAVEALGARSEPQRSDVVEELTNAAGENVLVPAPDEFAPVQEEVAPVAAPVEPPLTSAEETPVPPQVASFPIIKIAQETELVQEAEGVPDELEQAANDEQTELTTEKENETLENTPTVPLQELVSASEEGESLTAEVEMVAGEEREPLAVEAEEVAASEEKEPLAAKAEEVAKERESLAVEAEEVAGKERESLAVEAEEAAADGESALQDSPVESVLADVERVPAPVQVEAFLAHEPLIASRLIISSPYTHSSFEFLLLDEEIHIGRAGASDLYLEQDNLTSRHHALLKRIGERVLIFDKRSYNGVFLNGQKIEVGLGYELADGDHIGIGNYELIFRVASASHISQLI